jgi:hypothetical protein
MKPDPTPTLEDLQAMPGALPVPEIKRSFPKTEERTASNDNLIEAASLPVPHICGPRWTGTGLQDYAYVMCSCGWISKRKRYGYEDDQSSGLLQDKTNHLRKVAV